MTRNDDTGTAQGGDQGQTAPEPAAIALELRTPHAATAAVPPEQRRQWALSAALELRRGGDTAPLILTNARIFDAFLAGEAGTAAAESGD